MNIVEIHSKENRINLHNLDKIKAGYTDPKSIYYLIDKGHMHVRIKFETCKKYYEHRFKTDLLKYCTEYKGQINVFSTALLRVGHL